MKKLLVLSLCLFAVTANAEQRRAAKKVVEAPPPKASAHRMAGCGLGSLAIEDESKWSQVGASLLNGTGMQTFAISFGTSNCTEDGVSTASRERDAFIEANLADLRHDVAVGNGAYLSSLASLYGCKGESALHFGSALKKNESKVLGAANDNASAVIDSIVTQENASCEG